MTTGAGTTRTTCPYCGVGCGLLAERAVTGTLTIAGDPDHPANRGRLCAKGSALGETLSLDGRLLHPTIDGCRVSWNQAIDTVARGFGKAIAAHGPDSVAFYLSGQLLTEDYYVANKLMKGFIGSANIDTNSRLCMASAVTGHKRAFGADCVPCDYGDMETTDLVVLVGSNLAWCHPVLFQRLSAAKQARPDLRVVVVDPRRTVTAEFADQHLALAPGSDVALFNGLLTYLRDQGQVDGRFVAAHTDGLAEAAIATATDIATVQRITGLEREALLSFYDNFARTPRVVTAFSQGVNQSSSGVDKVNAIINCHLLTGRIGKAGMGPCSVTGQPNAMGGREVGGLATQLAAHMDLDNAAHRRVVQHFWQSPRIAERPGLTATELFRAVRDGRIRALWVAGTNPVDSLPEADLVRDAIRACPFVVVSDLTAETDTAAQAHVLLPALGWGEKDGTVTNSERRISRQRRFLPPPGEAKPDWWIFAKVAQRLGWGTAFDYAGPADIFAEHARLTALGNGGTRALDLGGLADLGQARYDALPPTQWPHPAAAPGTDAPRPFADGRFYSADGRARFVPTPYRAPASTASTDFPLTLNTGRIRDQWHTMTRTGKAARLLTHIAEPFVDIHPIDAVRLGIAPASIVSVSSPRGRVLLRAMVTPAQLPGTLFAPMHWTDQFASAGRVNVLVAPHVDPHSKQPELKFTPAAATPYAVAWYGFSVLAERPGAIAAEYWALAPAKAGWRLELADASPVADWVAYARALLQADEADTELLGYHDATTDQHRFAAFRHGRLQGALFVAPEPVAASRGWLAERLADPEIAPRDRYRLLAGRPGDGAADPGAIVCACNQVGHKTIEHAARAGSARVDAIARATRAGSSCGACRGEIKRILDRLIAEGRDVQKTG